VLWVVVTGTGSRSDADARLERLGSEGSDVAVELVSGTPAAALEAAAASSDLMVVGRHHPGMLDDSRLGHLAKELLARVDCPLLLTAPSHVHHRSAASGATTTPEEEYTVHARVGDRIVLRSTHLSGLGRVGEVIEVEREDGRPPYRIRWSDTGHESLFFPGPDAYVDRSGRSSEPEDVAPAQVG
jgi:hypothetical protein